MIENSDNVLIWDPDETYELGLAKCLNFDMFDHATVIQQADPALVKHHKGKKVAIRNWWSWAGGNNQPCQDLGWADLLVCYTSELIKGPWESYYQKTSAHFNNKNLICISNGRNNLDQYPCDLVYDQLGHFFSKIADLCQYQDWNTCQTKPKLFDALLGIAKPHRTFIYEKLVQSQLVDHCFVNIHGSVNYTSADLILYDDPGITPYARQNSQHITDELINGMSMRVPYSVYNNSWYSIVAETNSNHSNFVTEKTAKPLFAKKIFVVFGSQGLLARLQSMGYKTFDGIIDESYDNEYDDMRRWSMAFDQIQILARSDPQKIYLQAKDILEHNHHHICDHKYRLQGLKKFLDHHLTRLILQ